MLRNLVKTVLILVIVLLLSTSIAQARASFGIQPISLEFNGRIKDKQVKSLTVRNSGDTALDIRIQLKDFIYNKEYHFAKPGELPTSAVPYIGISEKTLTVPAKSTKELKVTFDSKNKILKDGKYSAILFVVNASKAVKEKTNIGLVGRISAPVLITPAKGNIKRSGRIKFFEAYSSIGLNKSILNLRKSPGFIIGYKNTGNVHLNIASEIEIFDLLGRKTKILKMTDLLVYPDADRDFTLPWDRPSIGIYKVQAKVKASLYDYQKDFKTETRYVFYLPWWLIILITLAISWRIYKFEQWRRKKKKVRLEKQKVVPSNE